MPLSRYLTLIAVVLIAALATTLLAAFIMPAGAGPQAILVVTLTAAIIAFYLRRRHDR